MDVDQLLKIAEKLESIKELGIGLSAHTRALETARDIRNLITVENGEVATLKREIAGKNTILQLQHIDKKRLESRIKELTERVEGLESTLRDIGDFAHTRSTGPAVPDDLWAIRRMAYDEL